MSRKPTPFATAQVLRGLETALRFSDVYVEQRMFVTETEGEDLKRARAWLEEAKKCR